MEIGVLHEDLEDLTSLISKEHVVWHDNSRSAARLEDRQNMLHEVQLLVGCFKVKSSR